MVFILWFIIFYLYIGILFKLYVSWIDRKTRYFDDSGSIDKFFGFLILWPLEFVTLKDYIRDNRRFNFITGFKEPQYITFKKYNKIDHYQISRYDSSRNTYIINGPSWSYRIYVQPEDIMVISGCKTLAQVKSKNPELFI